jgi:glutaredoxin
MSSLLAEGREREIENRRWLVADDGDFIKALLTRLTGRSTFPNVILHGKSIGGSDDISEMHKDGRLRLLFEHVGLMVRAETQVYRDEEA